MSAWGGAWGNRWGGRWGAVGAAPEPPVPVQTGHGGAHGYVRGGDFKWWRDQQLKKAAAVIAALERARDNERREAAIEAAQEAAEDIEIPTAVLDAAIDAIERSLNKKAQIIIALAEARRVQERIRQQEDEDDEVASFLLLS
jgi:hypothetical protein